MKRIILTLLFISTSSVAAVSKTTPAASSSYLDFVPADTIFFSGTQQPISTDYYSAYMAEDIYESSMQTQSIEDIEKLAAETDSNAAKFLLAIYADYMKYATDPKKLLSRYGVGDEHAYALYNMGAYPVLRSSIVNQKQLVSTLESIEKEYKVKPNLVEKHGFDIREYAAKDGETLKGFFIASNNSTMVVSINLSTATDHLSEVLGAKKPKQTLSESNILQSLFSKYDLDKQMISFLDIKQLVSAITSPKTNATGAMINSLIAQSNDENPFETIQTPACQKEIGSMASNWPMLIIGNQNLDVSGNPVEIDMRVILESKNESFLTDLSTLRGFIPSAIETFNPDMIGGFSLGLNVDGLLPFLNKVWAENNKAKYECPSLIDMQAAIKEMNPMAMGMFVGMASGISGLTFNLFDLAYDVTMTEMEVPDYSEETEEEAATGKESTAADDAPAKTKKIKVPEYEINNIDASLIISGRNAQIFVASLSTMIPVIPSINVGEGTEPAEFVIPIPNGPQLKVTAEAKGEHVIFYTGKSATETAADFTKDKIGTNGLMAMQLNYTKYWNTFMKFLNGISPMMEDLGEEPTEFKEINSLMLMSGKYDVTNHGLEGLSSVRTYKEEKKEEKKK